MQMQRMVAIGRLALVIGAVSLAGCAEGEWDWFGLKKTEPKQKSPQTAKARRPVKKEPAVADAKKKPAAPSKSTAPEGDEKSREVDEKVERYVRSMNAQYDPSYQNNDFSSKIQRQSDPNRAARVRQTAIRSRTEPTLDEAASQVPDRPLAESSKPTGEGASTPDGGGGIGESAVASKAPEPKQTAAEKPVGETKPTASESAIKPPVLSEVTVSASPTSVDSKPVEEKPAAEEPVAEKPIEPEPVQIAAVEPQKSEPTPVPVDKHVAAAEPIGRNPVPEHPVEPKPVAEKPVAPASLEKAPVAEKRVESPVREPERVEPPVKESPRKVEPAPKIESPKIELTSTEEHAKETRPRASVRDETPRIESPQEPKQQTVPESTERPGHPVVRVERPVKPKRTVANKPPMPPPQPVDTFKRKLKEQEAVVAKSPDNVEEQFKLRMMYLVDGQDEKALAPSSSMNAETQEILLGQIRTMIAARTSNSRDPAVWANQQLEALERLRGLLRAKADLKVPNVQLCRSIEGFGRYEPIEPAAFKAGGKNRVLLYIEVDNFHCDKTPSGLYRTLLSVRESLLNKGGEELWSAKDDNIEDLARQKRRDFYLTIGPLAIPKSLGPGEYTFKVEVEDVLGGKMNSNVVRFKMIP